ncbi:GPR1 FUN34 yaaH family [Chlorella sorokiniana]|uniref:GPR1 FUN34 yaaH family n=1 Tax=Chlorella sorokiniana TaxID=3076 RepID=A0A2P6TE51_CHLSO|nr:GPR1 FUN34 yaaH family [Chlorella sorokiniana]|eukprot:PRW20917.1 GPR1 FUN34 yaaH family [Chlorella sorokiniana]
MEEAAPAAAAAAAAPKPFLRRGAGWEARMAAAREGRRYVPRGGTVKDYSQGGEAPLPTRRRPAGSKPPRSPGKVAGGPRKAAGGTYSGQAATAVRQKPTAARAGRSAPPSAAASPARPRPHAAAPTATAPAPIPAAADWTRRLLQRPGGPAAAAGLAPAGEAPELSARRAEETAALQEFEALESQVLREVHTNSPLPHGSGSKKPASSRGGSALQQQLCSGPPAQQEQPAAPALGAFQAAVEPENWGALLQADDDVFASDGEGGVRSLFGEGSQAQAAAAGIANPLACRAITFGASGAPQPQPAAALGAAQRRWPPPVYCEEEDEGEMHAEASAAEAEALEQLQQEVVALQQERARVARMRLELEEVAGRLEQEKAAFEKRKVEDAARFEADRSEELRKLQRDRRVLEKQSRAIMKLPTKQSKEEVAAVEALLAEERRAARAREARHKLTVERLRQQLVELQAKNSELREQVLCLEQQRLAAAWVVSEVQHPDGRWERLFASGAREQRFANGSAKRSLPSGASLTRFANGDVKKVLPGGTVEYYFAEVASWQVTHPSGVDVFFFPSGQVEAHHPGGVKETTTTAVPAAATYTTGPTTYTTAADVGRHSYGGSADGLSLLAQRLQALTDDGVKINPATANPAPLGLYGFALTTALLQGAKTQLTEPVGTTQLTAAFGFFFGGLAQFCAGLLEYQRRNTFGTVAFCCFGAFWMSLAIFITLGAGKVYTAPVIKGDRLMLTMWGILTFLLWLCTFHTNLVTSWLFLSLAILFWLLAGGVGASDSRVTLTKVAGGWGFMVAATAFYDGTASLMKDVYGRQILPVFPLKPVNKVSLGDFGTKRFVESTDLEQGKRRA